jgi:transcriptional regulator with XRE-family HTH domain
LLVFRPLDIVPTPMVETAAHLAANVRRLREGRGLSQQQMARLSGIPRPTWASLESGSANPTLAVLTRAAGALQVSIEELIGPPRTCARSCRSRSQGSTSRAWSSFPAVS